MLTSDAAQKINICTILLFDLVDSSKLSHWAFIYFSCFGPGFYIGWVACLLKLLYNHLLVHFLGLSMTTELFLECKTFVLNDVPQAMFVNEHLPLPVSSHCSAGRSSWRSDFAPGHLVLSFRGRGTWDSGYVQHTALCTTLEANSKSRDVWRGNVLHGKTWRDDLNQHEEGLTGNQAGGGSTRENIPSRI